MFLSVRSPNSGVGIVEKEAMEEDGQGARWCDALLQAYGRSRPRELEHVFA